MRHLYARARPRHPVPSLGVSAYHSGPVRAPDEGEKRAPGRAIHGFRCSQMVHSEESITIAKQEVVGSKNWSSDSFPRAKAAG